MSILRLNECTRRIHKQHVSICISVKADQQPNQKEHSYNEDVFSPQRTSSERSNPFLQTVHNGKKLMQITVGCRVAWRVHWSIPHLTSPDFDSAHSVGGPTFLSSYAYKSFKHIHAIWTCVHIQHVDSICLQVFGALDAGWSFNRWLCSKLMQIKSTQHNC